VTRFLLADGIAELEDFMPAGLSLHSPWFGHLYRRVRCVRGSIKFKIVCCPAFDYGRKSHETIIQSNGAIFITPKLRMALSSPVALKHTERGGVEGEFVLDEGETAVFILKDLGTDQLVACPGAPSINEAEDLFQSTVKFWHHWLSKCTYRGRWREQVQRSALTLKLLTFEPTGAIVAAPTCSLPEVIGGVRNWDYRFTWIRDAAFTVYGFLRIGFKDEAAAFVNWMTQYASKNLNSNEPVPPVFTIQGTVELNEQVLDHWEGYRRSKPVRIGNQAVAQFQNDIYGELLDTYYLYNKYVNPISYNFWKQISERLDWICENWKLPDEGVWEMRNRKESFVYSNVMNWVALDRGIRLADKRSFPANRQRWLFERDAIYEEIMNNGWNSKRKAFTQFSGSENLDASMLILPLVFFMAPNDPRMLSTIDAILESPRNGGLVSGGLVYRYTPQASIDGLTGQEGTFNMCSFWLVEALTRAGRVDPDKLVQAQLLFERMLGFANHLGLYAEQTGPQGEALGNFPQAFTHLALISAAFNLDKVLDGR
jgi:GH15 family glucan-1,4-alpha-glucosidase